jgi:hypothetical protein
MPWLQVVLNLLVNESANSSLSSDVIFKKNAYLEELLKTRILQFLHWMLGNTVKCDWVGIMWSF